MATKVVVLKMELVVLMMISISCSGAVLGLDRPRPDPNQAAAFARWLVAEVDWCVLATIDSQEGYLFGNVISYTDGTTGVPYFYLTRSLDPTGRNAIADPNASFTISEKVLGTCGNRDPQSPVCSKLSLAGKLISVQENTTEVMFGESVLFQSHPQLAGWPKQSGFEVFKLIPSSIFLVNDFKPPKKLTVEEYLLYKFLD